jgi:hypothetical protein
MDPFGELTVGPPLTAIDRTLEPLLGLVGVVGLVGVLLLLVLPQPAINPKLASKIAAHALRTNSLLLACWYYWI